MNTNNQRPKILGVLPEEPESLPTSGEMTSPNFPSNYTNDLHERKTIEVAKGNVINIHFTDYELESPDQVDYLEITDGDGTLSKCPYWDILEQHAMWTTVKEDLGESKFPTSPVSPRLSMSFSTRMTVSHGVIGVMNGVSRDFLSNNFYSKRK